MSEETVNQPQQEAEQKTTGFRLGGKIDFEILYDGAGNLQINMTDSEDARLVYMFGSLQIIRNKCALADMKGSRFSPQEKEWLKKSRIALERMVTQSANVIIHQMYNKAVKEEILETKKEEVLEPQKEEVVLTVVKDEAKETE